MARPIASLVPSVEQRLTRWLELQARLHRPPALRPRPAVTLSRAFGCEGFAVAERVRAGLETATGEPWNLYDKALLEAVHDGDGISREVLQNLGLAVTTLERMGMTPKGYYDQVQAWDAVSHRVAQIAGAGNAVIVGRGGAVLCRALPTCFHFRLDATFEWRVDSVARRLELPRAEAEELVRAGSSLRDDFLRRQLKVEPAELGFFDAVFNNARRDPAEIAAAIVAVVREAWPRVDPARVR